MSKNSHIDLHIILTKIHQLYYHSFQELYITLNTTCFKIKNSNTCFFEIYLSKPHVGFLLKAASSERRLLEHSMYMK